MLVASVSKGQRLLLALTMSGAFGTDLEVPPHKEATALTRTQLLYPFILVSLRIRWRVTKGSLEHKSTPRGAY